jgi:hypothetical protein
MMENCPTEDQGGVFSLRSLFRSLRMQDLTEGRYFSVFLVPRDICGMVKMNSSKLFKQRCERKDHIEFQERGSEFSSPGFGDDPLGVVGHGSPSGC